MSFTSHQISSSQQIKLWFPFTFLWIPDIWRIVRKDQKKKKGGGVGGGGGGGEKRTEISDGLNAHKPEKNTNTCE